MTKVRKLGMVVAGYALAIVAALIAVMINDRLLGQPDLQASSGMTAFGDTILFLLSLALFSLPATIAGLRLLRGYFMHRSSTQSIPE